MAMPYHIPVMLQESVDALQLRPGGVYVDATFGGGGHSRKILEVLDSFSQDSGTPAARLIAFDQDTDAQAQAASITSRSFTFCHANFKSLKRYLRLHGVTQVDGILADLGISSHQIDEPERGFSTRFDGPLDMRMNRAQELNAAEVLNTYREEALHKVLGMYGEVRNARTAAHLLVQHRLQRPFQRTTDLTNALASVAPRGKEFKYFAQVFQALRIEVNHEMEVLEDFLHQCGEVVRPGGRLVVLSYHSLEDRMVKHFLAKGKVYGEATKDFYGNEIRPFEPLTRKPGEATAEEIALNNRARSARLRIGVRLEEENWKPGHGREHD